MGEDYLIRAICAEGAVRAFACTIRETVEEARRIHDTYPVCSAALGRTMAAALMMGAMQKEEGELVTVNIRGDGPIGGVLATAGNNGRVKGYVNNPFVDIPPKPNGKLDVSGAVGKGAVNVLRDRGGGDPYVGQTPIVTGEIGDDIAYYFSKSEQTASAVALGVLVDRDFSIKRAGGFIIQLMPGASEELIDAIEPRIEKIDSVTALLEQGKSPEDILSDILGDLGVTVLEKIQAEYYCGCTRERVEKVLAGLGREELTKIYEETGEAELNCHFCGKKYLFDKEYIAKVLTEGK